MNWTVTDTSVIFIGLAIVFVGLICIILLCTAMSALCNMKTRPQDSVSATVQTPAAASPAEPIPNRAEIVAVISAVIAEELGEDVSSIRILSLKKI